MNSPALFDCAIAGGGIGGLSLSIQLARQGWRVVVLEKEHYPFHKVCGEYVSMESASFLRSLGFVMETPQHPRIGKFLLSDTEGRELTGVLPLGGIGISRYHFDEALSRLAVQSGVVLVQDCQVTDIRFDGSQFTLISGKGNWKAKTCCGAAGKKSRLDPKGNRGSGPKPGYVGIKYHIQGDFPSDRISLHLFRGGYCGLSPVENGIHCLCYLTTANVLAMHGHDIDRLQKEVLSVNPFLRSIFCSARFLWDRPVTTSGFHFSNKPLVTGHTLRVGDAAAMISPLCGNGMSMALLASSIAAKALDPFLNGKCSRQEMEEAYGRVWRQAFSARLRAGRWLQGLFIHPGLFSLAISALRSFPGLTQRVIRLSHGSPF